MLVVVVVVEEMVQDHFQRAVQVLLVGLVAAAQVQELVLSRLMVLIVQVEVVVDLYLHLVLCHHQEIRAEMVVPVS
jgi:hypothetical protein